MKREYFQYTYIVTNKNYVSCCIRKHGVCGKYADGGFKLVTRKNWGKYEIGRK